MRCSGGLRWQLVPRNAHAMRRLSFPCITEYLHISPAVPDCLMSLVFLVSRHWQVGELSEDVMES